MPEICGKLADTCAVSTPSTISGRSPGVITTAPSNSRSSTLGSVIAATTRPVTSRASSDSSPLTSVPSQAAIRSPTEGALSSGSSGIAKAGHAVDGERLPRPSSTAGSSTRLAMTANSVPCWARSSPTAIAAWCAARRAAARAVEHQQHRGTEVGGDAGVVGELGRRADVGVVAAHDHHGVAPLGDLVVALDDPVQGGVGVGVHLVVGHADALVVGQGDGVVGDQQVQDVVAAGVRRPCRRAPPDGRRPPCSTRRESCSSSPSATVDLPVYPSTEATYTLLPMGLRVTAPVARPRIARVCGPGHRVGPWGPTLGRCPPCQCAPSSDSPRSASPSPAPSSPSRSPPPAPPPAPHPEVPVRRQSGPRRTRPASARPAPRGSNVWFTLQHGRTSEVFYPDLSTPSIRNLELVVTDGGRSPTASRPAPGTASARPDARSLGFTQTNTDKQGRYRITKTVRHRPAPRRRGRPGPAPLPRRTEVPALRAQRPGPRQQRRQRPGPHRRAQPGRHGQRRVRARWSRGHGSAPRPTASSAGSDGWTDLRADHRLTRRYRTAGPGNVVQTGRVSGVTGRRGHQNATLTLGLGATAARARVRRGRPQHARLPAPRRAATTRGLARLPRPARGGAGQRQRACGGSTSPRRWCSRPPRTSGTRAPSSPRRARRGCGATRSTGCPPVGRLPPGVVPRRLPVRHGALGRTATGRAARASSTGCSRTQQKADGSFPQNSDVTGRPVWSELQLDEVALPIVLAHLTGRDDAATYAGVKKAADFIADFRDPETGLARAVLAAGALGEPVRLLAELDRRADRRARVRGATSPAATATPRRPSGGWRWPTSGRRRSRTGR